MKRLIATLLLLPLALVALPAQTRAASGSFTFTNGPVICGPHPSCYVTQTSLGGWYYLYAFLPTAIAGGTVPSVYVNFNNMATANGTVHSLSGLVADTWTQLAGTAKLDSTNQYELRGTFSGTAYWGTSTSGHAYGGTIKLDYGIYYTNGGSGRGGGGAGWHFKMLSGTTTITYR